MNANRLFWGILIIAFGALCFLQSLGIVSWDFYDQLWRFWPVLLIIWGGSLLLGGNGRSSVIFSAVAAAFLIVLVTTLGWLAHTGRISDTFKVDQISEELNVGILSGELNVKFGAAKLKIESGSSKFVEGDALTLNGLDISSSSNATLQKVEINQMSGPTFIFSNRGKNELNLKLNPEIKYDLKLDTGASDFDLDLRELQIAHLEVSSGATSGQIKYGSRVDRPELSISTGASSYDIKVPKDYAIVVYNSSGLSSNNFSEVGLKKSDQITSGESVYADSLYETNKVTGNLITIRFSAGASSLNISRY